MTEVSIEVKGVPFRAKIDFDMAGEWYERFVGIDDSERDITDLLQIEAPGFYAQLLSAIDVELARMDRYDATA